MFAKHPRRLNRLLTLILCTLSGDSVRAAVVVPKTNLVLDTASLAFVNYQLVVAEVVNPTDSLEEWTRLWLYYDGDSITYRGGPFEAGANSLFVVQAGDALTNAGISSGQIQRLEVGNGAVVATGDFYLGVAVESLGSQVTPPWKTFGWVHLAPAHGALTMIDNAMSYDSPGIIVGTTTLVPEPDTPALAAYALAGVIAVRRRTCLIKWTRLISQK